MTITPTQQTATEPLRTALSQRTRPPRPSALATSLAFGWRALLRIKHVPEQLFDVTMFPIMFLLLFTYLFGGALAGSTGEYLQFVLPGILVMSVVMITMYTGIDICNDIEKGVFDRIRSLPIWRPSALVGALLGDAARYSIACLVMISLGVVLGFRPEGGVVGVLAGVALLLVFCFSLSWLWTLLGLYARSEKSVMGISMMVLFPLTFLSNILVDPETLPSWLESFVGVNPISLLVTAVRGLMHGTGTAGEIATVLVICAGLVAVFGPLTMRRYARLR
jgi:ABC-2 type transport system permease protein